MEKVVCFSLKGPARDLPLFLLFLGGVLFNLFIQMALALAGILLLIPFNAQGFYDIVAVKFIINIWKQRFQPYREICHQ